MVAKEETEMDRIAEEVLQEIILEEIEEYEQKEETIEGEIADLKSKLESLNFRLRYTQEEIKKRVKRDLHPSKTVSS